MANPHDHRPGDPHSLHPPGLEEQSLARVAAVPLVELVDVSNGYGTTPALTRVSLKIWPGQFMAIVGPNGGGKTTLLRTVLGMVSATSGKVLLRGQELKRP
jgi:ABC-type multidrug transport system ATPase subunit